MLPEDASRIGNWRWRITHLYKIQTKKAQKITFKPKPIQKWLMRYVTFWPLLLILKARQEGVSTFFLLLHLDATLFTPNCTTVILSHEKKSLQKLFRIIKVAYESCPDTVQLADGRVWHKPKAKFDNANELYFEGLDSRIYVALEVRSDTVHRLHVSEWAHIKKADERLAATLGAVVEGGFISGETTANGMAGSFYEEWQNQESPFMKLFFGYQDDPDYCDDVPDEAAFRATLTPDEQHLLDAVPGMKLGNIAWRRRQLAMPAKRKKFKQEFPCTPLEAFLTTGRSPFNREKIQDWPIRAPIERAMEGRLLYWVKPIKDRRYILSCDSSSGAGTERITNDNEPENGTDYSSITIIDCETHQTVARFRGKWPYSKLHHIVYRLGKEYNWAYVAVESFPSGHGMTVINNLVESVGIEEPYPQWMIHTTESIDKKTKAIQQKWGWETTAKSKPLIIDHISDLIEEESIKVYDEVYQNEFMKFIINEKGQYEAMEGYKDDCVMSAAIGYYLIPNALRAGRRTATKEELGLTGM